MLLSALLALLFMPAPPAGGQSIDIPRIEAGITIDGVLDEPEWERATRLDGFSQYLPADGRPAAESTEVFVWYSATAIHFGIRAQGTQVRATLADRDKISGDDYILILLDTFNDQRQAYVIGVNPLGIQTDGILRDAPRRASMMAGDDGAYLIDRNPDFVYSSRGRLTPFGYEVEVAVPFKSLRYQTAATQQWGINIIRKVQHSGHEQTWSPVLQSQASFLAQSGTLAGITDIRRGLVLDVNPELTASAGGAPGPEGWAYDYRTPSPGGNVRWGVTNNLTLTGTVNPDFSQVEADVAQVQYDPRRALFYPEKRPFFLDGIELFQMPNQLVYTRRVADPLWAAKLSGKVGETNVAALSAMDRRGPVADASFYQMLRLRRDLGGQSSLGAAYTDRVEGDRANRVFSADGRMVFASRYSLTFQGAASLTSTGTGTVAAPLWDVRLDREGSRYGFNSFLRGYHGDFQSDAGFIPRVGVVYGNFTPRITRVGAPGAAIERWTGSVTFDGTWDYDRFTAGHVPNDAKLHLNSAYELRGGWRMSGSLLIESFKYPAELYTNYFIERRVGGVVADTIAYTGTDRLFNLDVVGVIATPRFQKFSGSLFVIAGQDENFFEWASANIFFVILDGEWRPTDQLRVNLRYNHQQYLRSTDNSNVGLRRVPRLKVEYQLTRALFVRAVGQYDSFFQDDLRDDSRTNDPILIYNPATGAYARAVANRRNSFRVDWLVSYRPTPGTVFFLGYGSTLSEPDSFRFRRLDRREDGVFMKLSYLFRAR